MKQKIIFLIPLILLFSVLCCAQKQNQNDWQKLCFKGKVKFYSIDYYDMDASGEIYDEHDIRGRYYCASFNEDGWMTSEQDHTWSGIYYSTWTFTYYSYEFNITGKKWPSKKTSTRGDTIKSVYTYDNKGNLLEVSNFNSDKLNSKATYKYDADGYLIENNAYDSKENLENKITFTIGSGYVTEERCYNSGGIIQWRNTYTYDSAGNKTERKEYLANDSLVCKYTYSYDTEGKLIEEIYYKPAGTPYHKTVYTYHYYKHVDWSEVKMTVYDLPENSFDVFSSSIESRYINYY